MKPEHKAIADIVLAAVRPLKGELAQLRERINALEAAPLKHMGAYELGRMYEKHSLVTHQAGAWVALRPTQQVPGEGDGWRCCGTAEVQA